MHAVVVGEFGVKRGSHDGSRAYEHRGAVVLGEHFDVGADSRDARRADEHGVKRRVKTAQRNVGLEAVDLAAVGVAPHRDVDCAERALVGATVLDLRGQQDHARARAEDGHAVGDALAKRVEQLRGLEQF